MLPDDQIIVAIRPEKLLLTSTSVQGSQASIKGKLKTFSYLGDRSHFYISINGREEPLAVATHEVEFFPNRSLQKGSEVWLSWAKESLVLLPAI